MAKRNSEIAGIANSLLDLIAQIPASNRLPSENPKKTAQDIINTAALKSAGISAALAIPPGPLGLLTVLPDLVAIWRIQAQMVSDIAAIYGKSGFLTREALLFCLFKHGAHQLFRDVVVRVGERYVLRKTSLRFVQRMCERLGLRVSQRVLGATVSRWIPIAGAVAVGWYTRYDTKQVGQSALELFSHDLENSPEELKDVGDETSERNQP